MSIEQDVNPLSNWKGDDTVVPDDKGIIYREIPLSEKMDAIKIQIADEAIKNAVAQTDQNVLLIRTDALEFALKMGKNQALSVTAEAIVQDASTFLDFILGNSQKTAP